MNKRIKYNGTFGSELNLPQKSGLMERSILYEFSGHRNGNVSEIFIDTKSINKDFETKEEIIMFQSQSRYETTFKPELTKVELYSILKDAIEERLNIYVVPEKKLTIEILIGKQSCPPFESVEIVLSDFLYKIYYIQN